MASAAPERRLAIDGCPYTRIEFQEWYGDAGERLWADAGPERLSSSDAPQLADRRTDGVTQPNRTVVDQPAQSARAAASSASSWLDARTVTRDAAQLPPGTTTRDAAVPPGTATRDAATQVSFSCPATPASSASSCLDASLPPALLCLISVGPACFVGAGGDYAPAKHQHVGEGARPYGIQDTMHPYNRFGGNATITESMVDHNPILNSPKHRAIKPAKSNLRTPQQF